MFLTGFFTGLVANVLSLVEATKGSVGKVRLLFKSPGFLAGDFFVMPAYFGLAFVFFAREPAKVSVGLGETLLAGLAALVLVVLWGRHFSLLKINWLPHGLVAWLVVFMLFVGLDVIIKDFNSWPFLGGLLGLLVLNQILGAIFPKRL